MRLHRVLVTGASGFIGGRIVERLAIDRLDSVRALVHKWSRAARVAKFPIDIVAGDIMCRADAEAAMEGVTHVVHCAFGDAPEVIVEGTRTLLDAALLAGVERFVYVSTAEVYGANVSGTIEETLPTEHSGRTYGDAKIDAENLCREFQERGLSTTIVRPSIVYGPFGRSWSIGTANRLKSGNWCEFEGFGDGYCNAVYVDDLVSAILLAAQHPAADGETFNVNGPDVVTWNEYFRMNNAALGLPALTTKSAKRSALTSAVMSRVEGATRSVVALFQDRLMEIYLRGGHASRLMKRVKTLFDSTPKPRELKDQYQRSAIYSDRKLRTRLGYKPQYDLQRGLEITALWLAQNGYVELPAILANRDAKPTRRSQLTTVPYSEPVGAPP